MKRTNSTFLSSVSLAVRLVSCIFILCFMTGCAGAPKEPEPEEEILLQSTYQEKLADSMDEAVLVSIDEENEQLRFYNLALGRTYTLTYNGATGMKNRFGDEIVTGQLASGDMVRVTFLKEDKLAKSIQILSDVAITQVDGGYEINKAAYTMSFGGNQYSLHKNVAVISDGKRIQLEEINPVDGLKIAAKDHEVYGITVEKGHGYVRLTGHESFVGGWIEVGQAVIKEVADEMLLVVPEGEYTLYISKDGVAGSKEIVVEKDAETLVDVSELETEKIKKSGKIIFTITPSDAKLYIDGKEVDYSKEVELDYGIHQMVVKAPGYSTLAQYIKVGQPIANLNVEMEKAKEADEEDTLDETEEEKPNVSSNSVTTGASDYRVYIDAPTGAELYLDGSYVGIVPANFAKKPGTYIVSLRRDGFRTRSYTLQIDDSKKDVTYSFSELLQH